MTKKKFPEITFKPFHEDPYGDLSGEDDLACVRIDLVLRFEGSEDSPLRLAETILANFRVGEDCMSVPGTFYFNHDDESLPPTVLEHNLKNLPAWLKKSFEAYRKDEVGRLKRIIEALESPSPDSCFDKEEIKHRKISRVAQDQVFGSREELREKLDAAKSALQQYSLGSEPERAQIALAFIEGQNGSDLSIR